MKRKVRISIVGIGNSASYFLRGMKYYADNDNRSGLWHPSVGGYRVSDLEVVSAYDVDSNKIGLDLSNAIKSNKNTKDDQLTRMDIPVLPGILKDSLPVSVAKVISLQGGLVDDIADTLEKSGANVVLNLISSGLIESSKAYAEASLKAGCCFINATPTFIASDAELVKKFIKQKLVVAGDDLMSQFGGTVFHKGIVGFMDQRGMKVEKSYQLDVGGGTETLNTIDEDIRAAKRKIKTTAISAEAPYDFRTVAGTTDYVDYLNDNRTSYFWIEGKGFLNSNVKIDIYLRTNDGSNAGNVLLDVVRAVYAAKERGDFGSPMEICGYGFKHPPTLLKLPQAFKMFEEKHLV
jgi:myo-inositol-1-phosphate synthase